MVSRRSGSKNKAKQPKNRLQIEYWPVSRLNPYERNPRKNDKAVSRMQDSIREYGFTVPVLAQSDGLVIDGHLRLKGAIAEGIAEVPVIPCDGWTPAQVKAFRLMANRSVAWADWDMEALALEFGDLKTAGFDLNLTGFDSREIDGFTLQANAAEDDVPPVPGVPVTKPGDLWILGNHRLLCGDSTKAEDVARLLGDRKPSLMVTDQPYGVEYDPAWRDEAAKKGLIGFGAARIGKVTNDDRVDWSASYSHFTGDVIYLWHAGVMAYEVLGSLHAVGFIPKSQIIWRKPSFAIGRAHYHWQHEPCWYAVRSGARANWRGDRSQTTIWDVGSVGMSGKDKAGENSQTKHGTQKPVEIMRRPILNHTLPGESVYDPFLGSGTTLIAAELTDRLCFGLELEPGYCDVIRTRWENLTGKRAVLESTI